MRTVEDAQRAMESLNGTVMNGRPVRVDFSATQKAHNPTPGQYKGERKPGCKLSRMSHSGELMIDDDSYSRGGGYGRDRYDDRRPYDGGRDRYDDRDRERLVLHSNGRKG
jgi:transformer-2 protein